MGFFQKWVVKSDDSNSKEKEIIFSDEEKDKNMEKTIVLPDSEKQKNIEKNIVFPISEKEKNIIVPNINEKKDIFKVIKLDNPIYVYTDGACTNNGKPNAKAGIGIYFGEDDRRNVSKRIYGKQTNNAAELDAILEVFNILDGQIRKKNKVIIFTDSEYAIKCFTTYGRKLAQKGWEVEKPIPNYHKVKKGYLLFTKFTNVKLQHIKAHTNKSDQHSIGNSFADKLAVESLLH